MVENESSNDVQNEKTYTYREYLARFPRQHPAADSAARRHDQDPSEVGKEMARQIIGQLLSHG